MLTSDFKVCFPVPCFEASLGRPVIPSVLHPSVSIGTARGLVGRCFFFFVNRPKPNQICFESSHPLSLDITFNSG